MGMAIQPLKRKIEKKTTLLFIQSEGISIKI